MSHIIPKFVFDWMKESSGGGAFRHSNNPNVRQQDGIKQQLLCSDCEEVLGKSETWFARNIFHKVHSDDYEINIQYDQTLSHFVISILWRILVTQIDKFILDNQVHEDILRETEDSWRKYLLNLEIIEPKKKILLIFTTPDVQGDNLVKNFIYWFSRGVDGMITFNSQGTYVYAKFTRFILIGDVRGLDFENFPNTEVQYASGRLKYPTQQGISNDFIDFFQHRIEVFNGAFENISDIQRDKISNRIIKNKDKLVDSDFLDIELRNRSLGSYMKKNKF